MFGEVFVVEFVVVTNVEVVIGVVGIVIAVGVVIVRWVGVVTAVVEEMDSDGG